MCLNPSCDSLHPYLQLSDCVFTLLSCLCSSIRLQEKACPSHQSTSHEDHKRTLATSVQQRVEESQRMWIADLDMSLHWIVGPLILVQAFCPFNQTDIQSKTWLCVWRCQAGRPRRGRSAWDFSQFRPFLACVHLKSKLLQNLWNLLELNKIWMEHSVKLNLFSRGWWSECEVMAINTAPPSLNFCSTSSKA